METALEGEKNGELDAGVGSVERNTCDRGGGGGPKVVS